mgnify:CR=1 FL=1
MSHSNARSVVSHHNGQITNEIRLFMLEKFLQFLTLDYDRMTAPPLAKAITINSEDHVRWQSVVLRWLQAKNHDHPRQNQSPPAVPADGALQVKLAQAQHQIKQLEKMLVQYQQLSPPSDHHHSATELRQLKIKNQTLVADRNHVMKKLGELQHQIQTKNADLAQLQKRLSEQKARLREQTATELRQLKIKNQTLVADRNHVMKKLGELQHQIQTKNADLAEQKAQLSEKMIKIGQFDPQTVKKV